jgi:hypothetical protein
MSLHHLTGPLALAVIALGGVAAAADPARTPRTSDVVLARAALKALDDDPQLKDVNLVISVVDRVAVVGGPVATTDVARRAERVLRERVPGLVDVKSRCFEQSAADPLLRAVADNLKKPPAEWQPPRPGELPGLVPHPVTGLAYTPPPRVESLLPAGAGENSVTSLKPPTGPPAGGGVLLDPVRPDRLPVSPVRPDTTSMANAPPAVLTTGSGRPGDLLLAAASVRRENPEKFGGLTAELKAGTLVIGGTARQAAHAWEYADALRRVPGMVRVAIGAVDVP